MGSASDSPGQNPISWDSALAATFRGGLHALDNLCSVDGSVAVGNGFFIYLGRFYPHPADIGDRNGIDPNYSGTKSTIARALKLTFSRRCYEQSYSRWNVVSAGLICSYCSRNGAAAVQ
jgi:hypothetical protein